ncbi:MAG: 2,3-bisphosphoglycerate-independent phosphoglycerate mutase [Gemmatimonadetes bacterium]|nr:2,3-bisphosphoglycerate-independent phosphoglycerate mutase [Gemmatimonadota bacterium]
MTSPNLEFLQALRTDARTKILFLVLDGLGGLPLRERGPTELEAASTPNLDALARSGVLGIHDPVGPGITPGSGVGHLALFGYDPIRYRIGRGVLEALGVDFALGAGDVAARGNFCSVDAAGAVVDRRAGRLSSERARALVERLRAIELPGVQLFVEPVKEHRFLLVLRGPDLSAEVTDTDPGREGVPALEPQPRTPEARATAELVRAFVSAARARLGGERDANMVVLRGFDQLPAWPSFGSVYGLRAAAIAAYPMYRGVARVLGMPTIVPAATLDEEFDAVPQVWADHDFVFLHVKDTDRAGEDGDFQAKVNAIEDVDARLPRLLDLKPDVVVVTGDHSTPARLRQHSWHAVPLLLWSSNCRPDELVEFSERACVRGSLGRLPATDIMPLALGHAGRLARYGA